MNQELFHKIAVFCIGNYYLCDDGFAIHLFRILHDTELIDNVELYEFGLMGFSLLDRILPYGKLIIIDGIKGMGKPGEVFRFDLLNNSLSFAKTILSAHDFGIIELLEMVKKLYPEQLPQEVILLGPEVKTMDEYGTTLTPELNKALLKVKEMVLKEIRDTSVS